MRIINYLAHCQKLGKFTVMSQPTILKLKVSKTGHAIITFRNFFNEAVFQLKKDLGHLPVSLASRTSFTK